MSEYLIIVALVPLQRPSGPCRRTILRATPKIVAFLPAEFYDESSRERVSSNSPRANAMVILLHSGFEQVNCMGLIFHMPVDNLEFHLHGCRQTLEARPDMAPRHWPEHVKIGIR